MTKYIYLKDLVIEEMISKLAKVHDEETQKILDWYFEELKKVACIPDKDISN